MRVAAGTKLREETYEVLRWLAYRRHTTVSALIASYVEKGVAEENLDGVEKYVPAEPRNGGESEKEETSA